MLVLVGAVVVCIAVFGGFAAAGGHLAALWQPYELIIIGGAAIGSMLISSPMPLIKEVIRQVLGTLKSKDPTKAEYLELLSLLFELCKTAKANPLSLEPHVEKPEESDIFKRYPGVLANHHAIHFICDTLKVQLSASMNPYDLEDLMDTDLKAAHEAEHAAPATVQTVGDAMPGLGIVAAVLGVVHTMSKLSAGKEAIGASVGSALVGTFLGILLAYGFMAPLAAKMNAIIAVEGRFLAIVKACLLAYAKDCSPKVCVEFGRRAIPHDTRPSFTELDETTSAAGKKAA